MEKTTGSLVLHHGLANQLRGLQESSGFSTMGAFLHHLFALEEQSRSQQCLSALFTSVEQPWLENYHHNQVMIPDSVQPPRTASVGVQVELCCRSKVNIEMTSHEQSASSRSYSAEKDEIEEARSYHSELEAGQFDSDLDYSEEQERSEVSAGYDDTHCTQNTQTNMIIVTKELTHNDCKKPATNRRKSYSGKHPGYSCEECGAKFKHKMHYVHHLQKHRGEKTPQPCKYCPRIFPNPWRLKLHVTAKHPEHAEPPRDKPLDEPILCHICGHAMKSKHTYTLHLRSHTDERPYKCLYCPRTFKWASAVEYHRRTHTKERLFNCHLCDKTFRYQCNLANHQLAHTGEKPHKCPHCSQAFTAKPSMKEHVRKQHENPGEKPHKCPHCHKAYSRKFSMNNHIKKKHSNPEQVGLANASKSRSRRSRKKHVHVGMTNVMSKGFGGNVVETKVPLVPLVKTKVPLVPYQGPDASAASPVQTSHAISVEFENISLGQGQSQVVEKLAGQNRRHRQAEIELAEVMAGMLSS